MNEIRHKNEAIMLIIEALNVNSSNSKPLNATEGNKFIFTIERLSNQFEF